MDDWRVVTIDEIKANSKSALSTGPFGSAIGAKTFRENGVPVIRGGNLSQDVGTRLLDDGFVFVDEDTAKAFRRSSVREGDLIFTCWGTINQIGLIDSRCHYREYIISNKQMKLTPDRGQADSRFLYYLFSSPTVQSAILANGIGSSVPGFNLGQLRSMEIDLPPLSEQRAISGILGALDDKIELNRKMSETLEAMAQALFKSWFVDFDPVRAKAEGRVPGLPSNIAALFPDSFEDSELGEMPKGWLISTVGSALKELVSGARPRGGAVVDGIPSIGAENIIGLGKYDYAKEKFIPTEFFKRLRNRGADVRSGDVALYKDGAQIGRKSFFDGGFPHELCAINEHVFILRPTSEWMQRFMYFWLDLAWVTSEIVSLNSNSAQPGINQAGIRGLPMLLPDDKVARAFDDTVRPMTDRLFSACRESRTLTSLRDALLPRLISGEIRVAGAERALDRSA